MSASTAAKSNACMKPLITRCASLSDRAGRIEWGPLRWRISGKRPHVPAFKIWSRASALAMTSVRLVNFWETGGLGMDAGALFILKLLDRHRVQGSDPTHPVLA